MFNGERPGTLSWVHFGDLHMTTAAQGNYHDFVALIDQVNSHFAGKIDFCLLPGDNADDRLVTESDQTQQVVSGRFTVAARAWSAAGIAGCRCRINNGLWLSMGATSTASQWILTCAAPKHPFVLTVEARDNFGDIDTDTDTIQVAVRGYRPPNRAADGSDADTIGAWPERHILGTQLGPNRNGRQW
jgi:3',5'-cyclic-AMP phosphodiesterase